MEHTIPLPQTIAERTNPTISFRIVDQNNNGISIDSLVMTLYDERTGNIINGWNKQPAFNANGVDVTTGGGGVGTVSWQPEVADMTIQNANSKKERHIALWEWTWNGGLRFGKKNLLIEVQDLAKVP